MTARSGVGAGAVSCGFDGRASADRTAGAVRGARVVRTRRLVDAIEAHHAATQDRIRGSTRPPAGRSCSDGGYRRRARGRRAASDASTAPRSSTALAALAGSSRRATTSSSSSCTSGSSRSDASSARRSRIGRQAEHLVHQVAPAALGQQALGLDERAVLGQLAPRAPRRRSPRTASVLTIGTRQPPSAGASESTPRISRTIVSRQRVVGLVDHDDVGDLHHARP